MAQKYKFLGKEISGRFTIPSGIITTNTKSIELIAKNIPEIGIITTKSIGLTPRDGNKEPIITQYAPGCFMNAVGLTNPGAEEFAKQLEKIELPKDKFLLISIFGKNTDEFVNVAKILEKYADGFELNLSCPHASGYGMAIGQDRDMVKEIVAAIKKETKVPIIPKLTPNVDDIKIIGKAAKDAGADGICAINTVGPGFYSVDGNPVLTNKKGGMSGKGILPIGLKCIKELFEEVDLPLIACGGISGANDIIEYKNAGAKFFGVGSALVGLSTNKLKEYFKTLENDLIEETNNAEALLKKTIDMQYKKYVLKQNKQLANDFSLLVFDKKIDIKPGQFIFAWIPGFGEKPFSVLDNNPLTLAIQKRGCFTKKLCGLVDGTIVYFRGPYGTAIKVPKGKRAMLIGGGCGLAAVYQIATNNKGSEMFIGAKDKLHLFYVDEAKKNSKVFIATDDGSCEHKGFVTEVLKKRLENTNDKSNIIFYNCGPENMIKAAVAIEKKYVPMEQIYNSIDYVTKCGVGICGSCADKNGKRICVDGPFIEENEK